MAEGDERIGLFDLIGLGFSSKNKKIARPVVPSISITVNSKEVALPDKPVRSTNANGITGYDIYKTTFKLPPNTTEIPVVSASADHPDMKVAISQPESISGTAIVKFDYKGVVKTYHVMFVPE